jgi:hypothetical protein
VPRVLGQDLPAAPLAETPACDRDTRARCSHEPLREGVHPRRPDRSYDYARPEKHRSYGKRPRRIAPVRLVIYSSALPSATVTAHYHVGSNRLRNPSRLALDSRRYGGSPRRTLQAHRGSRRALALRQRPASGRREVRERSAYERPGWAETKVVAWSIRTHRPQLLTIPIAIILVIDLGCLSGARPTTGVF